MAEAQHAQTVKSSDQQFEASQQEEATAKKPKAKATTKQAPAKTAPQQPQGDQESVNLQAVMEHYNVDEGTARAMLEAEKQGFDQNEILDALKRHAGASNG
jgi:phytoene/squalene synthetase